MGLRVRMVTISAPFSRAGARNARKRPVKADFPNFRAADVPPGTNDSGCGRLRPSVFFLKIRVRLGDSPRRSDPSRGRPCSAEGVPGPAAGHRAPTPLEAASLRTPDLDLRDRARAQTFFESAQDRRFEHPQ